MGTMSSSDVVRPPATEAPATEAPAKKAAFTCVRGRKFVFVCVFVLSRT